MYKLCFKVSVCNFNLPAEIDIVMSVTKKKSKLGYRCLTKGCIMHGAVKQIFFSMYMYFFRDSLIPRICSRCYKLCL